MKYLILIPVRIYQWTIAPFLPPACRYYPSCSNYMIQAVQIHGAFKGAWMGLKRVLRCAPWGGWGYDPVPPKGIRNPESGIPDSAPPRGGTGG